MGDDLYRGVIGAIAQNFLCCEALMHLAMALPGDDLDFGLRRHVLGEVLVGNQQDARHAQTLDHLYGVRGCAADVALKLRIPARRE